MKLKTSPLFLQNQFYKLIVLIGLACLSSKAIPQEKTQTPGLIESYERLIQLNKEQLGAKKIQVESNLQSVNDLSPYSDVKLDPDFVKSILLNSDDRYLKMAQIDECRFLSSLENSLLKTIDGNPDKVIISLRKRDGTLEKAAMLRDDFFEQVYKKKCLQNKQYSTLFSETNATKTIEGVKFTIPKTTRECSIIHSEWLNNPYTPYLCRLQQVINRSPNRTLVDQYKDNIPLAKRIYLDNLCQSLNHEEFFCAKYLKEDIWTKVLNSEVPEYKISYKCQQLMGTNEPLTPQQIKNCASRLATNSQACLTTPNKDFPAYFPMQTCENISNALVKSKLITDYQDCPAVVDNEGLTNLHRVLNHVVPRKINSAKETCMGEAANSLAILQRQVNNFDKWPLQICYHNQVEKKETCESYIPGSRANDTLSEDQVVARILYKHKGATAKTTCKIVDTKTYNPLRSEYKYGCFIVYDPNNCSGVKCDKKVYWEEKLQSDIRFQGFVHFDYYPSNYLSERYSFTNLLTEVYGVRYRVIRNITDVKQFLDRVPKGIIHGIGCAEDLLPEIYRRDGINQCHALPFIIDGHITKDMNTQLVVRLAIDDLHTPRLWEWSKIYNAVSSYQDLNALNTWTLNGVLSAK